MKTEERKIAKEELFEVCHKLSETCDFLVFVAAADYPERGIFELVYYLQTLETGDVLVLKTEIPREEAEIHSVAVIWPAAEWHEREIFDLFGVKFTGHPDLRRILLPEDWEGYPLRKDYARTGVVKRPETIR
ncbi:NADH-quinone oxidoreductase subunit C [Candidatus Saganbacteria bacterium]|uniref:NADH-quinone oxidoreductase n=1 Tax=Candidatus Saganbacteria bacterium TaxID=2575572 RepID=A0A9D6UMV1_UNCSA|nr:NADH-quinone oxidoreductase subunit C [Candidatus Saganbacteria bacterium]